VKEALAVVGGILAGAAIIGGAWYLLDRRANSTAAASATASPIPTYNPAGINGPQAQQTTWIQDAREGVHLASDLGTLAHDWGLV